MKTFLCIGAGPGMGLATAERFARGGFQVVLSSRSQEKVLALAKQLTTKGYSADAQSVDASDPASVAALVEKVTRKYGAIEVLHYNAVSKRVETIDEQAAATFNSDLAVNIGGALSAVQAVLPGMSANGSGTILLTGGALGVAPRADRLSMSVGKAGIRALALGLYESMKERGIHIATLTIATAVAPGSKEAEEVAEKYWELFNQPLAAWTVEAHFPA